MQGRSWARRLALGAAAAAALAAAPASAQADDNLALPENGGEVHVSSELGSYPSSAINNGERDGGAARGWQGFWNDATNGAVPDWAEIRWDAPQRIDRIVVRIPIGTPYLPPGDRELGSARIQWYDDVADRYVDVVDDDGGDNPVLDWYAETVEDPGQTRAFAFPSVTTTRVRVLIEKSAADGNSWLDEIEAYGAGCVGGGNVALPEGGGIVSVSSAHSWGNHPAAAITNGQVDGGGGTGFWNDDTNGVWPDWAQVAWNEPRLVTRVMVRIPVGTAPLPVEQRTLEEARIEYLDAATGRWLVMVDSRGGPNPVLDWASETVPDPGQTRRFHFAQPTWIEGVRVVIEKGSADGWSWLDEIEAHSPQCANANLARPVNGGSASASSTYWGYTPAALNNDVRDYWNSAIGTFPDWAQIAWDEPQTIGRLVLRIPKGNEGPAVEYRTLREVRVETWDLAASRWVAVPSTTAAPNPILNWVSSTTWDGSQERTFSFTPVTTDKVRVVIEEGTADPMSWLDEIEAYAR